MFFVADGTGGHVFSETYNDHLKNVARLRVIEQGGDPNAAANAADAQGAGARGGACARAETAAGAKK